MWMVEPWKVQPRPRCGLKYRHALHVSSSVACALVCPRHPHYFSIERRSRWRAHPWARQRSLPVAAPPSSPDRLDGGAGLEAPPSSPDRPAAGRRGSAAWRRDGQAVRGSPNEWRTLSQRRTSCPSIPGHRPTPLPQTRPAQCPPHRVAETRRGQSDTRPSVRRVRGSPNSPTPHAPSHAVSTPRASHCPPSARHVHNAQLWSTNYAAWKDSVRHSRPSLPLLPPSRPSLLPATLPLSHLFFPAPIPSTLPFRPVQLRASPPWLSLSFSCPRVSMLLYLCPRVSMHTPVPRVSMSVYRCIQEKEREYRGTHPMHR